ncbi:MAG: hypothetical protein WAO61_01095 [Solirubrobacterales bacterium]
MTDVGRIILISYFVMSVIGIVVVLSVFRSTRVGFRAEPAEREAVENRETAWGALVGVFLVVTLAITIIQIPYFDDDAKAGQRIKITGRQFAWTVDPVRVKTGRVIADVTSEDVAHGVGVYDPDGVMIKQVNVLPGRTQPMVLDLDKPGTYKLRCLEFCGIDHHKMANELEVTR